MPGRLSAAPGTRCLRRRSELAGIATHRATSVSDDENAFKDHAAVHRADRRPCDRQANVYVPATGWLPWDDAAAFWYLTCSRWRSIYIKYARTIATSTGFRTFTWARTVSVTSPSRQEHTLATDLYGLPDSSGVDRPGRKSNSSGAGYGM